MRILRKPSGGQTLELSREMLEETQRIEKSMIQTLNCNYFVAMRIRIPTIEHMLKRETNENFVALYQGFSKQLNELMYLTIISLVFKFYIYN